MKKSVLKILGLNFVIIFGLSVLSIPNEAQAYMDTWLKETAWRVEYDSYATVGLEILGYELPFGINVNVGSNAIGVSRYCDWALATCDSSQSGIYLFQ